MAKLDRFAQIAFNAGNSHKDELCEIPPLPVKKVNFKKTQDKAEVIVEKTYKEKIKEFEFQLKELKERYMPFLGDFSPGLQIKRRQWDQKEFQFRYEDDNDRKDFIRVLSGEGQWEKVIIPDYRGPIGRWTGFYCREFLCDTQRNAGKRMFLRFLGVDYFANIYLNGRLVGSHEGFFGPFEFDVTEYLHYEKNNMLVVEVKNDATTTGTKIEHNGKIQTIYGEKIYAATGLGWDDPEQGWHHCPPGAGIYNRVILEERSELFINSIFVRPDIDRGYIDAWVEVYNTVFDNVEFGLELSVFPKNFKAEAIEGIICKPEPAGPGINLYRYKIPFESFRLWSCDKPWLYKLYVSVEKDGCIIDESECQFGMRKFCMDEEENPKGTLYLNNKPVILRGANDMGHMQLCVCREDFEQLIDDILIAKLANMNFYRFTQRPVQEEIYEYCDMLGMMNQTDLPFFAYIKRTKFCEGIKQAGEMERLIRSHPSSIMVTYINEPFPAEWGDKGHISLLRYEMEDFFTAAAKAIRLNNPDRVIKHVEGDYDPPTQTGLSDFHCYNMWYTNHALPVGKLHKGYLPPIKKGWKAGCGEYGTEGLDPLEIMMEDYPQKWIPGNTADKWYPREIVQSQTYTMHGDWYEEQHTIGEWISESQRHQALATRIMTDAFRRRSDILISTAVHLLIDAWPSGWMKTLVDYRRKPKPAYFEYKHSLEPVRVNLRTDRFKVYSGDMIGIECWLLNDTSDDVRDCRIMATVRDCKKDYKSFEIISCGKAAYPTYTGTISFIVPDVTGRERLYIDAALLASNGTVINRERLTIEAFKRESNVVSAAGLAVDYDTVKTLRSIGIELSAYYDVQERHDFILIGSWSEYLKAERRVLKDVNEGTRAVFLLDKLPMQQLKLDGLELLVSNIGCKGADAQENKGLTFIARNSEHPLSCVFEAGDFSFMYNKKDDCIGFITEKYIECDKAEPLLLTYDMPDFGVQEKDCKRKLCVVGAVKYGRGEIILSALKLEGLIGNNPVLDKFIRSLFIIKPNKY